MAIFSNSIARVKKIIFAYTTPRCVGVDISSTAIKMVELHPDSLKIAKYSIKALAKNSVSEGVIHDIDNVSETIRQQWLEFKSNYRDVAIAVPYSAIVLREVSAPIFNNKYQLDAFIHKQLTKELDNEDIDFDYTLKNITKNSQDVSVVVAKTEKIEEYQAIIQITEMRVAAIDIESFAICHLFETILLKNNQPEQQIFVLDLGATRFRAAVFLGQKQIVFNEISVNYSALLEDIIIQSEDGARLADIANIHSYALNLIYTKNLQPNELVNAILVDIAKLLQLVRSALLVEKKINLADTAIAYLYGGNSLIPGVKNHLASSYFKQLHYVSDFFAAENQHIPAADLMRLIMALALATWGQQIGSN